MALIPDQSIDRMNEISAGAWRLYCYLARCRNQKTGRCCPSANTCAEAIGVHIKNVFKIRKELSEAQWARFDGNLVTFLLGFDSSKNATTDNENNELESESSKNTTPDSESSKNATSDIAVIEVNPNSSENATIEMASNENATVFVDANTDSSEIPDSSKNATADKKSQKRFSVVAKTLPNGSKNATAYKEEPANEPAKRKKSSAARAAAPPKSPFHSHPAVKAYREELGHRQILAVQATLIAETTGPDLTECPTDWREFLQALGLIGFKHAHNVLVVTMAFGSWKSGVVLTEAIDQAFNEVNGKNGTNGNAKPKFRSVGANIDYGPALAELERAEAAHRKILAARKSVAVALAGGQGANGRSDVGGATPARKPAPRMAPSLRDRARNPPPVAVQSGLDAGRPAVRSPEAEGGDDLELPF